MLLFLDSHVEVNQKWIEPLLARIQENRTIVVTPIIDIINSDTFAYTASPLVRGGFNWGLHFKWDSLPANALKTPEDFVKPIPSPTMAGGLFAIEREYFFDIGEYDSGMNVWGGENLEISFRVNFFSMEIFKGLFFNILKLYPKCLDMDVRWTLRNYTVLKGGPCF